MAAIYPVERTYLTLVPLELRKLLYLYVNTLDITFTISDYTELIYIFIYRESTRDAQFTMAFDKEYIKSTKMITKMLNFINILKNKMTYEPQRLKWNGTKVDITSLTLLLHHNDYTIVLQSYYSLAKTEMITACSIPICIKLIESLEKVYDALKKE